MVSPLGGMRASNLNSLLCKARRCRTYEPCGTRQVRLGAGTGPNLETTKSFLRYGALALAFRLLVSAVRADNVVNPTFSVDQGVRGRVDSIRVRPEGRILLGASSGLRMSSVTSSYSWTPRGDFIRSSNRCEPD
jgi:hypothetical protein